MWSSNNSYDDRRRSLTPVEPTLPQVHIHQSNTAYNSRLMGTPSVPLLPPVFHNNDGDHCPVNFAQSSSSTGSSSSISALLNPSSPTTAPPQLPPISSIPPSVCNVTPNTPPPHLPLPMNNGPPLSAAVNDPNITQQVLQAHRQELQREVSHLSMLLNRTTAILVGLDQAMASNANAAARAVNTDNSSLPSMNYGSPPDTLYNGQKSYTGLPSPPVNAGMGQKSYVQNVTLPPLSPPSSL
jgi:hypothetical protein